MKLKVKCLNCKHEWLTRAKTVLVTCASCGNKVRVREANDS